MVDIKIQKQRKKPTIIIKPVKKIRRNVKTKTNLSKKIKKKRKPSPIKLTKSKGKVGNKRKKRKIDTTDKLEGGKPVFSTDTKKKLKQQKLRTYLLVFAFVVLIASLIGVIIKVILDNNKETDDKIKPEKPGSEEPGTPGPEKPDIDPTGGEENVGSNRVIIIIGICIALLILALLGYVLVKRFRRGQSEKDLTDKINKEIFSLGGNDREYTQLFESVRDAIQAGPSESKAIQLKGLSDIIDTWKNSKRKPIKDLFASLIENQVITDDKVAQIQTSLTLNEIYKTQAYIDLVRESLENNVETLDIDTIIDNVGDLNDDTINSLKNSYETQYNAINGNLDTSSLAMKKVIAQTADYTELLSKKGFTDISRSIGNEDQDKIKLVAESESVPGKKGVTFKRTYLSKQPGIGKSTAISNFVYAANKAKDEGLHKGPIVIEVSRQTLGSSDIAAASEAFSNMDAYARYMSNQGYKVLMTFEEAQDTIGERLFRPMLLNKLEGAPYSIMANSNKVDLFKKDEDSNAIASRIGDSRTFKTPNVSKNEKLDFFNKTLEKVRKDYEGVDVTYKPKEMTKTIEYLFSKKYKKTGYRLLQELDQEIRAQYENAKKNGQEEFELVRTKALGAKETYLQELKRKATGEFEYQYKDKIRAE
jgi:hypothetical protein